LGITIETPGGISLNFFQASCHYMQIPLEMEVFKSFLHQYKYNTKERDLLVTAQ
jgi:hypothetical protein